jgi:ankyrin repeat protein
MPELTAEKSRKIRSLGELKLLRLMRGRMRASEKKGSWLLLIFMLGLFLTSPLVAQDLHLRVLAATGAAQEVKDALQKGADFNDHDVTGMTALMAAAGNNHDADVVLVLLQFGAVVDTCDINGETALMYAAEHNADPAVITALLSGGAGLETRDKFGRTPLTYAAKFNTSIEVLRTLLKAGASVSARDAYGMTPLLYSAWVGQNPDFSLELLSAGADPTAQNLAGRTLLEYAEDNPVLRNDMPILQQLREAVQDTQVKGRAKG